MSVKNTIMNYKKYALIDLHLHIDGSLPINTVINCAKIENITLPSEDPIELKKYLTVSENCTDLNEYLKCFNLPISVMQSKESLSLCAYDLVKELNSQGLLYAELRFAPQLHCEKGLTQDEVTKSILVGIKKAKNEITRVEKTKAKRTAYIERIEEPKKSESIEKSEKSEKIEDVKRIESIEEIKGNKNPGGIKTNLILCCMRGSKIETNLQTLEIAKKYYKKGVVAIDLAGAEALFPTSDYEYLFNKAKKLNIPYTIHAGEAAGAKSIISALDFGALRLGHGIRSSEFQDILKREEKDNIILELCPTSNLQTKAVAFLKDYPIADFIKANVLCTINTDNMTVSGTSLGNEFKKLFKAKLIDKDIAKQLVLNSVQAAFISKTEKDELLKKVKYNLIYKQSF